MYHYNIFGDSYKIYNHMQHIYIINSLNVEAGLKIWALGTSNLFVLVGKQNLS